MPMACAASSCSSHTEPLSDRRFPDPLRCAAVFATVLITHPHLCALMNGATYRTPTVLHAWVWSNWAIIGITMLLVVRLRRHPP